MNPTWMTRKCPQFWDFITQRKILENKLERKRAKIKKLKERGAPPSTSEERKGNEEEIEFDLEGELDSRVDQIDHKIKEIDTDLYISEHEIVNDSSSFPTFHWFQ